MVEYIKYIIQCILPFWSEIKTLFHLYLYSWYLVLCTQVLLYKIQNWIKVFSFDLATIVRFEKKLKWNAGISKWDGIIHHSISLREAAHTYTYTYTYIYICTYNFEWFVIYYCICHIFEEEIKFVLIVLVYFDISC